MYTEKDLMVIFDPDKSLVEKSRELGLTVKRIKGIRRKELESSSMRPLAPEERRVLRDCLVSGLEIEAIAEHMTEKFGREITPWNLLHRARREKLTVDYARVDHDAYGRCRCGKIGELYRFRGENICPKCLNPDTRVDIESVAGIKSTWIEGEFDRPLFFTLSEQKKASENAKGKVVSNVLFN